MKFTSKIEWSQWDHLLGKDTDQSLADMIGCSPATVHRRRRALGVDSSRPYSAEDAIHLEHDEREMLELVHRFGVSNTEIVRHWRALGGLKGATT